MLRGVVVAAIVVVVAIQVGGVVTDEQVNSLQQVAINQAESACNAQLPGGNWTVADETVDVDHPGEIQEVACSRNGTVRKVAVDIEIQVNT